MNFSNAFWRLATELNRKRFFNLGSQSIIKKPLKIDNSKSINIGSKVFVGENSWLMGGTFSGRATLIIKDNCQLGHFSHIVGMHSLVIENSVLLADRVFITDITHNFENIDEPVLSQGIRNLRNVSIGEGSWIGENVCILGASVGKHCVIGSNAVVTHDIPEYSIAIGNPAKVIKKYNLNLGKWIRVQ